MNEKLAMYMNRTNSKLEIAPVEKGPNVWQAKITDPAKPESPLYAFGVDACEALNILSSYF